MHILLCITKSRIYFIKTNTLPSQGDYICYRPYYLNEVEAVLEVLYLVHNPSTAVFNRIRARVKDKIWFDAKIANGVTAVLQTKETNGND